MKTRVVGVLRGRGGVQCYVTLRWNWCITQIFRKLKKKIGRAVGFPFNCIKNDVDLRRDGQIECHFSFFLSFFLGGGGGGLRIRVTEEGGVKNPIDRIMHFMMTLGDPAIETIYG